MSSWESGFGGLGTDIDACGVLRVLVLVWRMAWDDGGKGPILGSGRAQEAKQVHSTE